MHQPHPPSTPKSSTKGKHVTTSSPLPTQHNLLQSAATGSPFPSHNSPLRSTITHQSIFNALNNVDTKSALKHVERSFEAAATLQSTLPQCWLDNSNNDDDGEKGNDMLYASYSIPASFLFDIRHRQRMFSAARLKNSNAFKQQQQQQQKIAHHHVSKPEDPSNKTSDPLLLHVDTNWNQEFQLALDNCFIKSQKERQEAGKLVDTLLAHFDEECKNTIVPAFIDLMFDPVALKKEREILRRAERGNQLEDAVDEVDDQDEDGFGSGSGEFERDPLVMKMQKLQQQQKLKEQQQQQQNQNIEEDVASASRAASFNKMASFHSLGKFASGHLKVQLKREASIANHNSGVGISTAGAAAASSSSTSNRPSPASTSSATTNVASASTSVDFELHISLVKCDTENGFASVQQLSREIECQRFFLSVLLQTCFIRPLPVTIAPQFLGSYKGHYVLVSTIPRKVSTTQKSYFTDFHTCLKLVAEACGFDAFTFEKNHNNTFIASYAIDGRLYATSVLGLLPFLPPTTTTTASIPSSNSLFHQKGIMLNSKNTFDFIRFASENEIESSLWSLDASFPQQVRTNIQRFCARRLVNDDSSHHDNTSLLGLKLLASLNSSIAMPSTESASDNRRRQQQHIVVEILAQSLSHFFHCVCVSREIAQKVVLASGGSLAKNNLLESKLKKSNATGAVLLSPRSQTNNDHVHNNQNLAAVIGNNSALTPSQYFEQQLQNNKSSDPRHQQNNREDHNTNSNDPDSASIPSSRDFIGKLAFSFCNKHRQQQQNSNNENGSSLFGSQYSLWQSPDSSDLPTIVETLFPGAHRAFEKLGILHNTPFSFLELPIDDDNSQENEPENRLDVFSGSSSSTSLMDALLFRFAELIGVRFAPGVSAQTATSEYHFVLDDEENQPSCARVIISTSHNSFARFVANFNQLDTKVGGELLVGDFGFQWRYQNFILENHQQSSSLHQQFDPSEMEELQVTLLDPRLRHQASASFQSGFAFEVLHIVEYLMKKYQHAETRDHIEICLALLQKVFDLVAEKSRSSPPSSYLVILCQLDSAICLEKLERYEEAMTTLNRATVEISQVIPLPNNNNNNNNHNTFQIANALAIPILEASLRIHEALTFMELAEADARAIFTIRSKLHHQVTLFQAKPFLAKLMLLSLNNNNGDFGNILFNSPTSSQQQQQQFSYHSLSPLTPHLARGTAAGVLGMVLTGINNNKKKQEAENLLRLELASWENVEKNTKMLAELLSGNNTVSHHNYHHNNHNHNQQNDDAGGGGISLMPHHKFEDQVYVDGIPEAKSLMHSLDNTRNSKIQQQQQQPQPEIEVPQINLVAPSLENSVKDITSTLSLPLLELTLKSLHTLAFPPSTPVIGSMALVLNNLACLQVSLKKHEDAIVLYQREIRLLEEFCHPETETERRQLAQELHLVRMNLATALMHQTQWSKAELMFALAKESMEEQFGERSLNVGEVLLKKVTLYLARVKSINQTLQFNEEQKAVRLRMCRNKKKQEEKERLQRIDEGEELEGDIDPEEVAEREQQRIDEEEASSGYLTNEEIRLAIERREKRNAERLRRLALKQQEEELEETFQEDFNIREDRNLKFQLLSQAQQVLEDAYDIFDTVAASQGLAAAIEVSGLTVKQLIRRCCVLGSNAAKELVSVCLVAENKQMSDIINAEAEKLNLESNYLQSKWEERSKKSY